MRIIQRDPEPIRSADRCLALGYLFVDSPERVTSDPVVIACETAVFLGIEEKLGVALPPTLKVLLSGSESFCAAYDTGVDEVSSLIRHGRKRAPDSDLVLVGRDADRWLVVAPTGALAHVSVDDDGTELRSLQPIGEAWVDGMFEELSEHVDDLVDGAISEAIEVMRLSVDEDEEDLDDKARRRIKAWCRTAQLLIQTWEREAPAVRRVVHPKFGEGVVIDQDLHGLEAKLTVLFDDGKERVLLERFLRVQ